MRIGGFDREGQSTISASLIRTLTRLTLLLLKNRTPHSYPPVTPILLFNSQFEHTFFFQL